MSRQVGIDTFVHHFEGWVWDWLDVPALIRQADTVFENPMIDRDPVPTWADGPVALLGDAAHAMYPTGSNGGSQAIVDARVLGPFGLVSMVDERCGGTFDNIDDVIPPQERARFMAGYQAAAGFAKDTLNAAPPTIPHGARVEGLRAR
jgi:hypothetical protein